MPEQDANDTKTQVEATSRLAGLSRHDQHNLELKTSLRLVPVSRRFTSDLYLFLPKNLHAKEWNATELQADFHSRLRLMTKLTAKGSNSLVQTHLDELESTLAHIEHNSLAGEPLTSANEKIFREARQLGALLGEHIKNESKKLCKEMLLATSLANMAPQPELLIKGVGERIQEVDLLAQRVMHLGANKQLDYLPVLQLLQQYILHVYTEFLVGICKEQQKIKVQESQPYYSSWCDLQQEIDELKRQLAQQSQVNELVTAENDSVSELRLLKFSQIKKFFQAQMYIEVNRRETIRRFAEPAAAGAAACAALGVGMFEYISHAQRTTLGTSGLVMVGIGAALYVLKDRLKDYFRKLVTEKLTNLLPQAQQSLIAKGKILGKVQDWFGFCDKRIVPQDILQLRRRGDLTAVEQHLPEDILRFAQEYSLEPNYAVEKKSVQQIMRINVERFLKHLDDPYRLVGQFDTEGELRMVKSHRVYQFHACIQIRPEGFKARSGKNQVEPLFSALYRIVMDKNGIERVELLC